MIMGDSTSPWLCCLRTFKSTVLLAETSLSSLIHFILTLQSRQLLHPKNRLPKAVYSTTHNHGPWNDSDYLLASWFGLVVHSVDFVRPFQVGLDMSTSIWHTLPWSHRGYLWSFESFAYLLTALPRKNLPLVVSSIWGTDVDFFWDSIGSNRSEVVIPYVHGRGYDIDVICIM